MALYTQSLPLCNLQASRNPTVADDASCGFSVGSLWGRESRIYKCSDPTNGAAVWDLQGGPTFATLPDSPYDNTLLAEALDSKQDRLAGVVNGCVVTLGEYGGGNARDIRVTEGTWYIPSTEYDNVGSGNTDFLNIALCSAGLLRYVCIIGDTSGNIIKKEGVEDTTATLPTILPTEVLLASPILVGDSLIEEPSTPPPAGLETFTENLTIVSNSIHLNCQNKAFPVFYVTGFDNNPLNITISNDYGVVEATLIISTSGYPNGLITFPFVSYPSTYQPSGNTGRIVLKMNWVVGNFIWSVVEQSKVDKQNIDIFKSSDFQAENDNNYVTSGTVVVTDPTGVAGKKYTVLVASGNTTIDSIVYSIAGTKIIRLYNGSSWITKIENTFNDATSSIQTQLNGKLSGTSIASDAEMQAGTENTKFTTALRTTSWWGWIKTQAQTISGLWTFSGGITISGGRLLFTNTSTASGDGIYRSAPDVITTSIANNARHEVNNLGVRTKGTHTFEGTMFTNIVPTVKKIATVQTTGELTADYVATTIFQGIQRNLQTLVSSTTETPVFNPEIGSTLIPSSQFFLGSQWLYTIPFKLSTTGTVRFLVRFGEAATALTSRTILADTGTFSPSVTAQGGVLKVFFTVATLGASGTAVLICNIEVQINGKYPVFTVPLRTTSSVSTLVDNLLEITCLFGTSSASDRIDVENANCLKLS